MCPRRFVLHANQAILPIFPVPAFETLPSVRSHCLAPPPSRFRGHEHTVQFAESGCLSYQLERR